MGHIKDHFKSHWEAYVGVAGVGIAALTFAQQSFDIHLPAPWRSDSGTRLTVSMPDSGQISRCTTIRGTGRAPKGKSIWLVQRTVGHGNYYLKPAQDDVGGEGWSVYGQVGDDKGGGLQYAFQAILLDEGWGRWLPSIITSNGLSATNLPPHEAASPPVLITRNSDNHPCG